MSERRVRYHRIGDFELESGEILRDVVQGYHLDGELNADRDNLVVVFHALTGTPDAVGGWWEDLAGPGCPIDTRTHAVLCANLLGSCHGTSFRSRERRPMITTRDMVRLIRRLVRALGVESVALAVGGSLGGMVALEWAATFPTLTRTVVAMAAPAAHTAQAIGFNHIQRLAVERYGSEGLELARMVGMMSYRTAAEFQSRFGRERREDGRYQVQSYLSHQGDKLAGRFDPESYLALLEAMDAHDAGRGRGGAGPALRAFRGRLVGVGVPGDLLYSDADVRRWVDAAGAEYRSIRSIHGHDAFLLETDQVGGILRDALRDRPSVAANASAGRTTAPRAS